MGEPTRQSLRYLTLTARYLAMAALVIRSLNVLLGIFFTFLGTLKITPAISRELHKDLREEYAKFTKVLPGAKTLGYKVPSKYYRRGVGVVEILCGIVLLVIPNRKIKKAANIILLLAKLLNLYSHFAIDDQFERMAPTLVFFFMLVCRMVVNWQYDHTNALPKVDAEELRQGSYDKVNIRPSLPRQAKNKKE